MANDVLRAFVRLVRKIMRHTDYHALYPCLVQGQADDFTLDLLPQIRKLRGDGIQGVPIRLGLPGARVKVKNGTNVLLGWENGDPEKPYAALFENSGAVELIVEPDRDGTARVKTTGVGPIDMESEARIALKAPLVELGAVAASPTVGVGDAVVIPAEYFAAAAAPIVTFLASGPGTAALAAAASGNMGECLELMAEAEVPMPDVYGLIITGTASVLT